MPDTKKTSLADILGTFAHDVRRATGSVITQEQIDGFKAAVHAWEHGPADDAEQEAPTPVAEEPAPEADPAA